MDHDLLGHLLQINDPDTERRLEERMQTTPGLRAHLDALALTIRPLEADRDIAEPPPGLAIRAIARVAQHVVETGTAPPEPVEPSTADLLSRMPPNRLIELVEVMDAGIAPPSRFQRADVIVVASLAILALGLVLVAVPYWRHRANVQTCQNQLREFHNALTVYRTNHNEKFPQITEEPPHQTASSFLTILRDSGSLPATSLMTCPSSPTTEAGYAYSLGWRDEAGRLHGLRYDENSPTNDFLPILADRPPPTRDGTSPDHRSGQNVLYVGGNVRFSTTTTVGVNGDDIYRNQIGRIGAGLHRWDSVLGVGTDVP